MKTSIATVSISGELPEKLSAIAAAGFDGLEIFEQDFIAHDGGPREVGRMIRDQGLEVLLFQPFRDFEGLPEPHRSRAFERAKRKLDLMEQLETDLVLICSNVSPHALGGIDRAATDLAELGELAAERGLRIGFEALAWGRHVHDHRDAWEIVRRANHPNVGLILDSFHTLARKIDPESIRSIPGDKIFFVQLADAPLIEMDLLYWSRHFRNMPGEGDLNVVGFMRAVAATGYQGPLSLEIFNDQFRGGSPRTIAGDGQRSLVYLMDQVQRQEPDLKIEAPVMPPRINPQGIEFVEFAADEVEAEALGRLLSTLGFQQTKRHISKDVSLWSQGEIHLLINTEREGFAHSAYLTHGLTVCDIGLKVDDAQATVERGRALGALPFNQPVGPGELEIPAIRGVGSGLLHFVDDATNLGKLWDIDFEAVESPPAEFSSGLQSVDHLAQTMNYEEMLTWLLFYTSIFQVQKSPMVDLVDPGGLVRSQVIESEDCRLRITLNGADTHRTLAGRFVAESYGSSVQHIAFACGNLLKTAASLAERGFEALVLPGNYYEDLEARFGLDPELLQQLRKLNLLYDADENGEFLQLYSTPFGEGMFFEIVERRGSYRGYGAPNAPYRIAAQKRWLRAQHS